MNNVVSAIELSTKKEKTRKILEDNMIDGANIVVTNKCTEIWALYDEMQDELQMTMLKNWNEQMNNDYGKLKWNLEKTLAKN